ncbi:MAG: anti-sigma factor [Methylovirgula sp.]|uniref:anti-sigma factor family protein n=1 Tax=Methylovirgula sp. TaxID=1978224 RepID=UPI0030760D2F
MTEVSSSEYLLLHALADGELDAAAAMSLEARLAADPVLAAEYARILAVKERTKALGKPTVSPDFAARIAAITSDAKSTSARPQARILSFDHPSWRALAASVVLTAFAASGGTYLLSSAPHYDFSVEDQVANDHHRSLLATSPIDVVSTDRHTVKPWLDQKLGMSPPTADLSAAGFPLVGGRVDVVAGDAVPTLVYGRRKHLISVVAIPLKGDGMQSVEPVSKTVDGYNMVDWTGNGFKYLAVSDLDPAELRSFVDDFRKQ